MNRFVDLRRVRDDAAAKFDELRDALGYVEGREWIHDGEQKSKGKCGRELDHRNVEDELQEC
jgi:hypothetical protein